MGNVPAENRGTASGILSTMRNIGMVMGIAVSGSLFSFFKDKTATLTVLQGRAASTPDAFTYALHITFLVAVFIAILSVAASLAKGKAK